MNTPPIPAGESSRYWMLLISPDTGQLANWRNASAALLKAGVQARTATTEAEMMEVLRQVESRDGDLALALCAHAPPRMDAHALAEKLRESTTGTHTRLLWIGNMENTKPAPGKGVFLPRDISPASLENQIKVQLTEYLLEHFPTLIRSLAPALDVVTLSAAFVNSEIHRQALQGNLMRMRQSFIMPRDVSDEDLDDELVRYLDLALGRPPRISFAPNELLLKQDESEGTLWIVDSGQVDLSREMDGKEMVFHSQTTGRVVGAMSVTRRSPSFFNARANGPVTAIRLTYADLERALQSSSEFASCFISALTRAMGRRNRRSVQLQTEVLALNKKLASERDQLAATLEQLQAAQTALVQSGKMATLGELSAGVAHELNNPVAAILRSAEYARDDLRDLLLRLPGGSAMARMLNISLQRPPLSTREERQYRDALAEALGNPDLARRLVHAGIKRVEEYREILGEMPTLSEEERARTLEKVGSLGQSIRNLTSCGDRIAALVSSLRAYSRPENAPHDLLDVREGLDDTLRLFSHKLRGIEVERNFAPVSPVSGFPGELNQVWTNLISNAVQAMGGSGRLEVSTSAHEAGWITVTVADNGPGIPPEHQERIFDARFTTRKGRLEFGLGLGLPISKSIVSRHGGTIRVESRPGHTAFVVTLPSAPLSSTPSERKP